MNLNKYDSQWCDRRLPRRLRELLEKLEEFSTEELVKIAQHKVKAMPTKSDKLEFVLRVLEVLEKREKEERGAWR